MSKIWTPSEIEFMHEFYPKYGINYCVEHLGRTSAAVRGRAHILGISAPRAQALIQWTPQDYINKLEALGVDFRPTEPYVTRKTPIMHKCSAGHEWRTTPGNVLVGHGCPGCARKGGFDATKPGLLYYVHLSSNKGSYYKIGITNNTVAKRFRAETRVAVRVIKTWTFQKGQDARDMEKLLFTQHEACRVNVPGFLDGGGHTELFNTDVLGLDNGNL